MILISLISAKARFGVGFTFPDLKVGVRNTVLKTLVYYKREEKDSLACASTQSCKTLTSPNETNNTLPCALAQGF